MRILIDLDGVIYCLHDEWFGRYNAATGDSLKAEDVRGWGTHEYCKNGKEVYDYLKEYGVWYQGKAIPGAHQGIQRLVNLGHEVVIVSSPFWDSVWCAFDKGRWVKDNLPMIGVKNVVLTHRKDLVTGDVLIDDAVHNLESFPGYKVLFNQPWNEGYNAHNNGMIRVMDWKEVVRAIKNLSVYLGHHRSGHNDNIKEVRENELHRGASVL